MTAAGRGVTSFSQCLMEKIITSSHPPPQAILGPDLLGTSSQGLRSDAFLLDIVHHVRVNYQLDLMGHVQCCLQRGCQDAASWTIRVTRKFERQLDVQISDPPNHQHRRDASAAKWRIMSRSFMKQFVADTRPASVNNGPDAQDFAGFVYIIWGA